MKNYFRAGWIAAGVLSMGTAAEAEPASPPRIALLFEWIEIEQADLHRLVSIENLPLDGHILRTRIASLIEDGSADVVEVIAAPAFPGERGRIESTEERIYRTEPDPSWNIPTLEFVEKNTITRPDGTIQLPKMPFALETRNCGFNVEFDCLLNPEGSGVDATISIEKVSFEGMRSWGEGESQFMVPDFHSATALPQCRLLPGRSRLLSTHRFAEPFNPERTNPRILVFARAEIDRGPAPIDEKADPPSFSGDCGIVIEVYETSRHEFGELSAAATGAGLRRGLIEAIGKDQAKSVGTHVLTARTRIQSESILELIHPSEYDPAEVWKGGKTTPAAPVALERRNTGIFIDLEVDTVDPKGNIRANLYFENVTHLGESESGKAENRQKRPRFHSQRIATPFALSHGEPVLLGTFRPPSSDGNDLIRIAFIRGEIADLTEAAERERKKSN